MPEKVNKKSSKKSKAVSKSLFQRTTPVDIWRANKIVISLSLLAIATGIGIYGYLQQNNSFASSGSWNWTPLSSIESVPTLADNGTTYGMTAKSCVWKVAVKDNTYHLYTEVTTPSPRAVALNTQYQPFVASGPLEEVTDIKARITQYRGVNAQVAKGFKWIGLSSDKPTQSGEDLFINNVSLNFLKTSYPVAVQGSGFYKTGATSDPYVVFGYTEKLGSLYNLVSQSRPVKLSTITACLPPETSTPAPTPITPKTNGTGGSGSLK